MRISLAHFLHLIRAWSGGKYELASGLSFHLSNTHSPSGGPVKLNALQVAHLHVSLCHEELQEWSCPLILVISKRSRNRCKDGKTQGFLSKMCMQTWKHRGHSSNWTICYVATSHISCVFNLHNCELLLTSTATPIYLKCTSPREPVYTLVSKKQQEKKPCISAAFYTV